MFDEELQKMNQEKKDYLNGYKISKRREKMILDQIQRLRLDKMFPAMQYDDMPHGTDISDLSDYAVAMDELMEELKAERLEAVRQYTKIHRAIKRVKDDREREVLTYRYLQGERWEDICGLIGLSWMQTHRVHAKALENFEMI